MGNRNRPRQGRSPDPGRGRWRTIGIIATMVFGVGIVLVVNLLGPHHQADDDPGSHEHPSGPHGGAVVAIDKDNRFHAEAVFEPDGLVRLYTYGRELTEARPVVACTVCAAVRAHDGTDEYAVMLRPEPQGTDPPGMASRFAGRLPPDMWRGHLRLVVWSLAVDGDRFLFEIDAANAPPDPTATDRAAAAEAALYSNTGGKYHEEDVRANGSVPASRRYLGERPAHNDKPTAGERVCPVSRSRADARFVWVVGGLEYRFCCPPCIDEFVKAAKERPDEVRHPDFYRHQ